MSLLHLLFPTMTLFLSFVGAFTDSSKFIVKKSIRALSSSNFYRINTCCTNSQRLPNKLSNCNGLKASSNDFTSSSEHSDGKQNAIEFKVLEERIAYSRWRRLIERDVELPSGAKCSFDIISQKHTSIVVFSWDTRERTSTLIREFQPGPMRVLHGTVAGMYEKEKHGSPLEAAKFELEEEAHLSGGTWINLLKDDNTSIPVDKYSTNSFHCYLVLDPKQAINPRALDDEEYITIEKGYSHAQIMGLIAGGEMNIMSSYTCLLAFEKLRELGHL